MNQHAGIVILWDERSWPSYMASEINSPMQTGMRSEKNNYKFKFTAFIAEKSAHTECQEI